MKKNKKAFSLIEVLVATGILTIAVFGVYKLIGENSKLINNNDNYIQLNYLTPNFKECLDYLDFIDFPTRNINDIYYFTFGSTGTGCNNYLSSTGVTIDNIDYYLEGEITASGSNYLDWNLELRADGVGIVQDTYRQQK